MSQSFAIATEGTKIGPHCATWKVKNSGDQRRLGLGPPALRPASQPPRSQGPGDLGPRRRRRRDAPHPAPRHLGPHGQLAAAGRFHGWRLCTYSLSGGADWSKIDSLLFSVQGLPVGVSVQLGLGRFEGARGGPHGGPLVSPSLEINGRRVVLPVRLASGQGLTIDQPRGAHLWPGGMQSSQPLRVDTTCLASGRREPDHVLGRHRGRLPGRRRRDRFTALPAGGARKPLKAVASPFGRGHVTPSLRGV